jgi:large subunit ribosomal protein L10
LSVKLDGKKQVVKAINNVVTKANTLVIAEYHHVKVSKMTSVRTNARKSDVYLHVLKNTLAKRAVNGTKFEPLADKMTGPLIYSISVDPIAAAKIIYDFAQENSEVKIIAGMFGDKLIDQNQIKHLATIPSKEQLLATLLGMMQQVPASFVRTLAAIRDKKQIA